jgi:hypothetical protein
MPRFEITASVIDICLSSYLQYGPGETREILLSSLGLSEDDTVEELFDSISDEFFASGPGSTISEDEIKSILRDAIQGVDYRYIDQDGNACDEIPEGDRDDEEPYLYLRLDWTENPGEECSECKRWIPPGEPDEHLYHCRRFPDAG